MAQWLERVPSYPGTSPPVRLSLARPHDASQAEVTGIDLSALSESCTRDARTLAANVSAAWECKSDKVRREIRPLFL
jgi:hypothetical protein